MWYRRSPPRNFVPYFESLIRLLLFILTDTAHGTFLHRLRDHRIVLFDPTVIGIASSRRAGKSLFGVLPSGSKPVQQRFEAEGIVVRSDDSISRGLMSMVAATFLIYLVLFSTGYVLYREWTHLLVSLMVLVFSAIALRWIGKLNADKSSLV